MRTKNTLFRLTGKVQHYQWGGYSFLPDLLNITNHNNQPFAEYWLGAHDNFPSEIEGNVPGLLNDYILQNPFVLGKAQQQFSRLPYLFKVLDVKDMLSIQVHPSKKAAVLEFERENQAGIPLTASNRNYKDDNHKPELMVALSDFWLLHGFKQPEEIRASVAAVPEYHFMLPLFREGDYKTLYKTLMEMEQQEVNEICKPLLERIFLLYENDSLQKTDPNFWAARAALTFNQPEKVDRGIFSIYLLNIVHLNKGEAVFQDAGLLHAYLEGQNMEIMANSDNVLRGGLTPKHIDVTELMKHVSFQPITPNVIYGTGINEFEQVYASPAADFELSKLVIGRDQTAFVASVTTDIFIVMEGVVEMKQEDHTLLMKKGESAVSFAGAAIQMRSLENAVIFRASVSAAD